MSFLLDTNVVSEWVKPRPDPGVVDWLAGADEDRLYLSVIALAEIGRGAAMLPPGRRRDQLMAWLDEELPARFDGRILAIDVRVARAWGALMTRAQSRGFALGAMDGFFAATALVLGLTLVTRNLKDFDGLGIQLLDPWETPSG